MSRLRPAYHRLGPLRLRAGPISLTFRDGEIHNCIAENVEIVQRIYMAVRDRYWNTIQPDVSGLHMSRKRDSFVLEFDCRHKRGPLDFAWHATIEGEQSGAISFQLDGAARKSFRSNRIGFCVLLPLKEWQNKRCVAELIDGTKASVVLPGSMICPQQPLKSLRSLFRDFGNGLRADLHFKGETFEMEDQRNWTDASFKIYSPPLTDAIPLRIKAGEKFRQRIILHVTSETLFRKPMPQSRNAVPAFSPRSRILPEIGVGLKGASRTLSQSAKRLVSACAFSHVRSEISLDTNDPPASMLAAARTAESLGLPIELALIFRRDPTTIAADTAGLSDEIDRFGVRLRRIIVLRAAEKVTSPETITAFTRARARAFREAEIAVGTDGYFVEINRKPPPLRTADAVCYSVNPQVHRFDDDAIIDNLEGQYHVLETAKLLFSGKKLVVSPITLRPRFNPLAPHKDHGFDARQKSLLGAVWTLGSIIRNTIGKASSVTYYEITGDSGIMEADGRSVFPMFHVFADIGEFRGGRLRPLVAASQTGIEGCLLEKGGQRRYIIANRTSTVRRVCLRNLPGLVRMRRLDAASCAFACNRPLDFRRSGRNTTPARGIARLLLAAHAIVTVDEI